MRRTLVNALSTVLLGAAFFAAASPVSQAQTPTRRQAQTTTQTAPKTNAYARIKAFVDGETFLVVRLDLAQIDLEALDKTATKIFIETLERQDFDANAIKTARREFNQTFNAVKKFAEPKLAQFREEMGLREVYFVVPRSTEKEFFVYAPLAKSKRAAVLEFVAPFAPSTPFEVGSGLAFGTPKFNADYFKRFQAKANPRLEEFLAESTATLQIYVGEVNVAPIVALATRSEVDGDQAFADALAKAPVETRRAVETFDSYFLDGRIEIDLNALKTNASFRFASADAADKVRVGLDKLAEAGVAEFEKALAEKAAANENAEKYNLVPVARELIRGFLKSSLPKRDGAALTFELQAGPALPLANPLTGAIFGAALFQGAQKFDAASLLPSAPSAAPKTDAPATGKVEIAPKTDAPATGKVEIAPKIDASNGDDFVKESFDAFIAASKPAKSAEEAEEIVVTNPDVLNATPEGFHPTTVIVLYEGGHPATGVLVTLHSFDPTNEIKDQPKGIVDKEGKAVIVTGVVPGVRPGKYAVTLENQLNPVIEFEGYETVVRLIIPDRKYESPRGSGLSVEIKEGDNQFKFDSIPLYVVEPR